MSAKRVLLTAVLCLGLVFGFFRGGSAQAENVCVITPFEEFQTFSNSDCSSYAIGIGWTAVSPGLVNEYLKASSLTVNFFGGNVNFAVTPQEAANLWSPLDTRPSAELGYYCPTGLFYRSKFRMNIGKLAPGTYTLQFFQTLSHPVIDGTASCVDDQGQHFPNIIYSGSFDIFDADNVRDGITITP